MKIERFKTINYTPAVVLATKGWLEQNQTGIGEATASIHYSHSGIVAFEKMRDPASHPHDVDLFPIGVITWSLQPSLAAVFVEQAFVEAPWRRRGIFKALWADLMEQAAALDDVRFIRLGTNPRNNAARAVYQQLRGTESGIFYEFEVKR